MANGKTRKRKSRNLTRTDYRSDPEWRVAKQLTEAEIPHAYEATELPYIRGGKVHWFHPDFTIDRITFIEVKGRFVDVVKDSQKLILVKAQHPEIDLRLVFQRENQAISRDDPTTYAEWAETHGFTWAGSGTIPQEWVHEFKGSLH